MASGWGGVGAGVAPVGPGWPPGPSETEEDTIFGCTVSGLSVASVRRCCPSLVHTDTDGHGRLS